MAEYSRIAKGHFTATAGVGQFINLPFVPDAVEIFNYTAAATPAQNNIPYAYWDASMGQGYAIYEYFNATPVLTTAVFTSTGISTFSAGLLFQFGATQQVVGATAASPIVFTVTAHGYSTGDIVVFDGLYQSSTTGMPQICGMPFQITVTGANTFSVVWPGNGSNYTALSASPSGASVRKVLYPFLYAPGVAFIEAVTLGTTTTIVTTAPHNFVAGQQIAFRIPAAWGTQELNALPNSSLPGSPLYYYVTSVTNATTFVCSASSGSFTAFNTNQPVSSVSGQQFPQVVAVGDVNSGGLAYSGGNLYPSPLVNSVSTINGPAISGAFVNNTRQGFYIGAAASAPSLTGDTSDTVFWRAYLSDYSLN